MRHLSALILVAALSAGCQPADTTTAEATATASASSPVSVVDSIIPIPIALDRFRAGLPRVDTLSRASDSRESLVQRFANALAEADSTDLAAMSMSIEEFAWLYYPESEFTRPPYELSPEHVFLLIDQNSRKGLVRMLRRSVGTTVEYAGHACMPEPKQRAHDRLWEGCTVRFRNADGSEESLKLFGDIWERDGRFKLVSYANEL